jgi:hypothetical protein
MSSRLDHYRKFFTPSECEEYEELCESLYEALAAQKGERMHQWPFDQEKYIRERLAHINFAEYENVNPLQYPYLHRYMVESKRTQHVREYGSLPQKTDEEIQQEVHAREKELRLLKSKLGPTVNYIVNMQLEISRFEKKLEKLRSDLEEAQASRLDLENKIKLLE